MRFDASAVMNILDLTAVITKRQLAREYNPSILMQSAWAGILPLPSSSAAYTLDVSQKGIAWSELARYLTF